MQLAVLSDGASHNNGGACGIGVVILDAETKAEVATLSEAVGEGTNTYAEYTAFERGARLAVEYITTHEAIPDKVFLLADSNLIVSQVKGDWKTSAEVLPLLARAVEAVNSLRSVCKDVVIDHVPREYNTRADALSTQAVEKAVCTSIEKKYPFLK